MFGLLWLSLAVFLLVDSASDAEWFDALMYRDYTLPRLMAYNGLICYYFRVDQPCSATAIKDLLNLGTTPTDLTSYITTETDCQELQRGMRPIAEWVAREVFGPAITSANTAGVTKFEIIANIWALEVGYYKLKTNQAYIDFANALNSISDWTTVGCAANVLVYGTDTTVLLPDFVTAYDCGNLDELYAGNCSPSCDETVSLNHLRYCCAHAPGGSCCDTFPMDLCGGTDCGAALKERCCIAADTSSCCTGQ